MRGLYQHLKRSTGLSGRQARGQQFITDENGVMLRNKDSIRRQWQRFFNAPLNSRSPNMNPDVVRQVTQRLAPSNVGREGAAPDLQEVKAGAKALSNWKAPGPDLIPAELLKIDEDDEPVVLERLHAIIVEVWKGREMPQEWKDAAIKVLCKKGDRSNCNNFRVTSLLSHMGKVLAKIITNRLSDLYRLLQTTHHRLLVRVIGYRRKQGNYQQLSYAQALKRVDCQSVEATVRQRRLLFAGGVARQPDGRLPKRLMFGELVGGEDPGKGSP
eukprot:g13019.t1